MPLSLFRSMLCSHIFIYLSKVCNSAFLTLSNTSIQTGMHRNVRSYDTHQADHWYKSHVIVIRCPAPRLDTGPWMRDRNESWVNEELLHYGPMSDHMSHASLWSHVRSHVPCPMLHYGPMSDHMSPGHVLLQIKPGVASCNSARWTHTDTSRGTPVSPSPTTLSVASIKIKLCMIANFHISHKRLADSLCLVLVPG